MVRATLRSFGFIACLAAGPVAAGPPQDRPRIEGLWAGSWGGGEANGVVFQPVLAELYVRGDRVELAGFRGAARLSGTVTVYENAKRLRILPRPEPGTDAPPKGHTFAYELQGDDLTLTDADGLAITLRRQARAEAPKAQVDVQLVTASGFNEAGDLLVTEFTAIRVGGDAPPLFRPDTRPLKTKDATISLVQETGLKPISLDQARGLIRGPTPVVVACRRGDAPVPPFYQLAKEVGPPQPDSDAVSRTFTHLLRPGTLVFVLPPGALVLEP